MCGLVGVAGNLEYRDEQLMKRLLMLDYFRGMDSTGLAAITAKGEPTVVKAATHPINLFDMRSFNNALNGAMCSTFIGHNRAATLGKVNDNNAHPFQYGDIIGAHNGTLDRSSWKRLEEASGIETDVDSAAIFACINEVGIEETVRLMEHGKTSSTGAWALVWYDMKDDTINFLRNEHRPLWYSIGDKENKLIWASEHPMIEAGVRLTPGCGLSCDKQGYSFFGFEEDMHYQVPLIQLLSGGFTFKDMLGCKINKIKGREPAPAVTTTMGYAPFQTTKVKDTPVTTGSTTTSTVGSKPPKVSTVVTLFPDGDDEPFGEALSLDTFNRMAKYGCSYCGTDVHHTDLKLSIFMGDEVVLCGNCSSHDTDEVKIYATHSTLQHLITAH